MKIPVPNYTQTPNELFDQWLPHLNEGELKVLLVIMRKTFGWHKTQDVISISQLSKITGLHEETVVKAGKSLQSKGVIKKEVIGPIGKQQTIYSLIIDGDSNNSYPSVDQSGPLGSDGPVQTEAQKKETYKETIQKKQQQQEASTVSSSALSTAVADFKKSGSIEYTTPSGIKKKISESEIYSYFLKKNFSTAVVQQAIEKIRDKKEPIGNVFKLLEIICLSLIKEPVTKKKSSVRPVNIPLQTEKGVSGSLYKW